MSEDEKLKLLKEYYFHDSFNTRKGTIFPTKPNKKGEYRPYAKNSTSKPKFWLDNDLRNHLNGTANLAGVMKDFNLDFMAWDIDGKEEEQEGVKRTVQRILTLLHEQGLKTFAYESGGKGYHIEVKLNELVDFRRLKKIASFVKRHFQAEGVNFIDRAYPCGAAYRLFGCRHYKTGSFTYVVNESSLEPLSEDDSWGRLETYLRDDAKQNSIEKLYKLEQEYFASLKNGRSPKAVLVKLNKKRYVNASKGTTVSKNELSRIYKQGLNRDYRKRTGHGRYFTAYNLGRLFRYELKYDEDKAREEIENWLRRHYSMECASNEHFGSEAACCIESGYSDCRQETIDNCMNGYFGGKPFSKPECRIDLQKAKRYMAKLDPDDQCFQAMTYLIKQCNIHRSATIYQSYKQMKAGWKVGSSDTVKKILDKLYELNLVERIKEGTPMEKCSSLYRIKLPTFCYRTTC